MVELDQFKYTLSTYDETLKEVKDSLDLENKERRITELDKSMEEPGFWDDPERSTKTVREAKNLKDTVDGYKHLEQQYEDIQVMIEMGYEENDPAMIPEIQEMLDEFVKELEELRTKTLLSGEYDGCNAILKLNAGAGGTEAMDWCSMLYRMYQRWADKKGFTTEVLDFLDGDEAGLKSITLQVNGENAYGYLKSEKGIHRLVRVSPFDSAGRRQTSFASCDVMPEIEDDTEIEIISNYMLLEFLSSKYIRTPSLLKVSLSSSDFNSYSPANMLDKLLDMKTKYISENETLLSRYAWITAKDDAPSLLGNSLHLRKGNARCGR